MNLLHQKAQSSQGLHIRTRQTAPRPSLASWRHACVPLLCPSGLAQKSSGTAARATVDVEPAPSSPLPPPKSELPPAGEGLGYSHAILLQRCGSFSVSDRSTERLLPPHCTNALCRPAIKMRKTGCPGQVLAWTLVHTTQCQYTCLLPADNASTARGACVRIINHFPSLLLAALDGTPVPRAVGMGN